MVKYADIDHHDFTRFVPHHPYTERERTYKRLRDGQLRNQAFFPAHEKTPGTSSLSALYIPSDPIEAETQPLVTPPAPGVTVLPSPDSMAHIITPAIDPSTIPLPQHRAPDDRDYTSTHHSANLVTETHLLKALSKTATTIFDS